MGGLRYVTRILQHSDRHKVEMHLRNYLKDETIANFMNLTEEDNNIHVQTYTDVGAT